MAFGPAQCGGRTVTGTPFPLVAQPPSWGWSFLRSRGRAGLKGSRGRRARTRAGLYGEGDGLARGRTLAAHRDASRPLGEPPRDDSRADSGPLRQRGRRGALGSGSAVVQAWARVHGGKGNDKLWGISGDDVLWGGPGTDQLSGGPGRDEIHQDRGQQEGLRRNLHAALADRGRESRVGGAGQRAARARLVMPGTCCSYAARSAASWSLPGGAWGAAAVVVHVACCGRWRRGRGVRRRRARSSCRGRPRRPSTP
ncbi:hypothetical protein AB0F64_36370 [Streptomyces sp. NPDC026294]|uniref:hypothetical protein n=1 Tax=Streptomyces sp. NPDC026294 TaxID=3155362 RepID=UPI0033DD2BAB